MFCHKCGAQVDDQAAFCDKCGTALQNTLPRPTVPPAPGTYSPPGYSPTGALPVPLQYAGFWRRFAAALIDGLMVTAIEVAIFFILIVANVLSAADLDPTSEGYVHAMLVAYLASAALLPFEILFFAAMEASSAQASPGKMALGIKVTDLDGKRVALGRAALRVVFKLFPGIVTLALSIVVYALASRPQDLDGLTTAITFLLVLLYLVIPFSKKKQGLHDMIAGTLVVVKS